MPVLMTAQLPGGTKEMIDGMTAKLSEAQRTAQGFILHANGPVAGGWRVTEAWDSQSDFEEWFEASASRSRSRTTMGAPSGVRIPPCR